jgi:type II secretory pathway pseudopilin PulG
VVIKSKSEAGFSLVAVLIIMGVVMFSILLISQAKFRAQGTQKALKVKQSYADVNQALINGIVESFHTKMVAACPALNIVDGNLDGRADYKFSTAVLPAPPIGPYEPPAVHVEASERCKSPKIPSGGGNRFYFCVKLAKDASAPNDSILGAKNAFAEVAVELIDLQTQQPITCSDYFTRRQDRRADGVTPRDGSAGMAVTMALYWANEVGHPDQRKYTFSQKALSYIANQN